MKEVSRHTHVHGGTAGCSHHLIAAERVAATSQERESKICHLMQYQVKGVRVLDTIDHPTTDLNKATRKT